jgi:FtsP/CotA-like multicopper oxidase with cupredoxin domain
MLLKHKSMRLLHVFTLILAVCGGDLLSQPPTISSVDGLLNTTLYIRPSFIESGPFTFQRRSYNGLPVGPTLRVKRGDKVIITVANELGDEPETIIGQHYTNSIAKNFTGDWLHDKDVYSRPNHTNIHLHGLHVSPQGNHDNIFRHIPPLSNATYEYQIPKDHPTGTFWYHPHLHMSSSLQLASGMMGAFIIEDDNISDPHSSLRDMEEIVLVVHEVAHSHNNLIKTNIICYFCMDNFMWPSGDRLPLFKNLNTERYPEYKKCGSGKYFPGTKRDIMQWTQPLDCTYVLLNGIYQPDIAVVVNVMKRWRFVQSSHQSTIVLLIDQSCEALVFARDGIYFDSPRNITGIPLIVTAGSRVDMGIRCSMVGRFNVSALPGGFHNSTAIPGSINLYEPVLYPRLMATIVADSSQKVQKLVKGEKMSTETNHKKTLVPIVLPKNPLSNLMDKEVHRKYTVTYNLTGWGTSDSKINPFIGQFLNGGEFSINGKSFTNRTEHCMVKDLVEEWTIVNAANRLDRWEHSFHIHQNSFQIVSQDNGEAGQVVIETMKKGEWRDTVQIPVHGSVTFRIQAKDYLGKFPFHCHVTAHQGIGMMQLVEVFDSVEECPKESYSENSSKSSHHLTLLEDTLVPDFNCPSWFGQPLCSGACIVAHCASQITKCISNITCRTRLVDMNKCMKNPSKSIYWPSDCLIPDNKMLDDFFHCAMEEHPCLNASAVQPPAYPLCKDNSISGDNSFSVAELWNKTWYKVHSWKLGEPVECMPCQSAIFSQSTKYPTVSDFHSTWKNPDENGTLWPMHADALLGPRNSEKWASGKLYNYGEMFGLTFEENYTVVTNGLREKEPYLFFYVCGQTLQGNYTTAFVLATKPTMINSSSLRQNVERIGLKWKDFCVVNNTCFS